MELNAEILEKLKSYGVGQRKLDDPLFIISDKPPPRYAIYDLDEENLCHEIIQSTCVVPGCQFTTDSLLEFENHYNAAHRYACSQCKKVLPSPHLLDLHIQESHDSFFAVMAAKKPSYCCFIEECKEKFINANERLEHCVQIHKLPKDFRFGQKPKTAKKSKLKNKKVQESRETQMEFDNDNLVKNQRFNFTNNKQKVFTQYTGRKFTKNNEEKRSMDVNMDNMVTDLKHSLPS